MRASIFASASVLLLLPAALAGAAIPDGFKFPAGWAPKPEYPIVEAQFDHLHIHFAAKGDVKSKDLDVEGRKWRGMIFAPASEPKRAGEEVAKFAAEQLSKTGWEVDTPTGIVVAHRKTGTHAQWLSVSPFATYWSFELVEEGTTARVPTVVAPSAKPETVTAADDFPYIGHFEGTKLESSKTENHTFEIAHPGVKVESVWGPVVAKRYVTKEDISPYECIVAYRTALKKTAWTIDNDGPLGSMGNGIVRAHFAGSGRDLNVKILCDHRSIVVELLDGAAASDLAKLKKALDEEGSISLYGIYFDIDKDTLRPQSEATLVQIQKLLALEPKLKLEVQGHTDDTGASAHNKELSERRAAAVRQWLVDHKVDAARLTAGGYGETKPVADNKTPEGRAKNRRVTLVKK